MVETTIEVAQFEGKTIFMLFYGLLIATDCSILVLLWARSIVAPRFHGWAKSRGLLLLAKQVYPFPLFLAC